MQTSMYSRHYEGMPNSRITVVLEKQDLRGELEENSDLVSRSAVNINTI